MPGAAGDDSDFSGLRPVLQNENIRNFAIIAHIDHGKSTLADRFIQLCGGLSDREMAEQVLDSMDLERERGITIKSQSVALDYRAENGKTYRLNLIDTPGHVDFSYEVSRSLAACEGALLIVDATQGVEAQSVANCYTAVNQGLEVLPVVNKMDLPAADPERVCREIEEIIGLDADTALRISARTGDGVEKVLEQVIARIPPPGGESSAPLQALIIDSWFDAYLGVISLLRVVGGKLRRGDRLRIKSTGREASAEKIGIFTPKRLEVEQLQTGEVGFVVSGVKEVQGMPVGDTLISAAAPDTPALPGLRRVEPRVYASLFAAEGTPFDAFREAFDRLSLNDAALQYEPTHSDALGPGLRCGFLGLLHMEIIQQRLEREYDIAILTTAPTVAYEIACRNGNVLMVSSPSQLPSPSAIAELREPIVRASILCPRESLGSVIELCMQKRGEQREMLFVGGQVMLEFDLPMSEIIADFFDRLKSVSSGYASLDYTLHHYQPAPLVRLDLLLNGDPVDALASIVHRTKAQQRGRELATKIKEIIPRQMYEVAIQAAIGGKVVARETVKALRKNVTAKCYGGDVSRKRKLLDKQRAGKKRMKRLGRVDVPQEAFMAVLSYDSGGSGSGKRRV